MDVKGVVAGAARKIARKLGRDTPESKEDPVLGAEAIPNGCALKITEGAPTNGIRKKPTSDAG